MNRQICITGWLLLCGGLLAQTLPAQEGNSFSKIPTRTSTGNRITTVESTKSVFREREESKVERFDRQRTLADREPVVSVRQVAAQSQVTQRIAPPPEASVQRMTPPVSIYAPSESPAAARNWRQVYRQEFCDSAREMYPHLSYSAPYGGSYYFRPYQAAHIGQQAELVGNRGGDRRNPYDNRFLQAIYPQPGE